MKIDFSILWIDDNLEFVDSLRDPLGNWMDGHGFTLNIHARKNEDGMLDDLQKHVIELIIIDYNLPKKKGDELIRDIRAHRYYQDIVFYSQGGIPREVYQNPLDGVFSVAREDARDLIKRLLELRIRSASDLATVRGWIVADSIELEQLLDSVLSKCFQEKEDLFTERVLRHENLFDFGKKHAVLGGIIKDTIALLQTSEGSAPRLSKLREYYDVLKLFPDEIINVRNTLAHQLHEVIEGGMVKLKSKSKGGKAIDFTPETCAGLRKNIRKHRENLVGLYNMLCEK